MCLYRDAVNILPTWKLNDDDLEVPGRRDGLPLPTPELTVQGVCDYKTPGRYGIHIQVRLPFINQTAEAPGGPEEVLPDSDKFEREFLLCIVY
jgi:hypothetical protein